MTAWTRYDSPIGRLTLASDGTSITGLWIEGQKYFAATLALDTVEQADLPVLIQTKAWLDAYFTGRTLPMLPSLAPAGTEFRKMVWSLLLEIPYGQTTTYGKLAQALVKLGQQTSARAVGGAVGHNPISILIPCHRVIGTDGSLTGYAGGIEVKRKLLELERAF